MAKDVTFRIKIEGSDEVKKVTVDTEELGAAFHSVQQAADDLKGSMINWAAITQTAESVQRSVSELQSAMAGLASAYAAQESAESKLQTVMRNTMDASDAEIQSIKDLASAQQQLGVIGDEVQLAGAQELATYLSKTETLKKLIPVMNDMVAQQYGLEASQESAAQIATMLGKVMEGQTTALSRYGYSFTEAQEEILKFGTEEERAATLADVVSESVGGVNAELAKTDSGRMKQLENTIGDIKEQLGAVATAAMPFLTVLSQLTMSVVGVVKLANGFKTLTASVKAATAASTTLKVAIKGLMISSGVGAAIVVLTTIIEKLATRSDKAAEGLEDLKEAADVFQTTAASTKAELDREISTLGSLIRSNGDTAAAVQHLNEAYGKAFGTYSTAAEWYDVLSQKSSAYARQVGYEAQARRLAISIAEKELELEKNREKQQELTDTGKATRKKYTTEFYYDENNTPQYRTVVKDVYTNAMSKAKLEAQGLQAELDALNKEMSLIQGKMDDYAQSTQGANAEVKVSEMNLDQVKEAIENTEKALSQTTDEQRISTLRAYNEQLKERQQYLKSITGLGNSGDSGSGTATAAAGLTKAIENYRASVKSAIEVNDTFNGGQDEALVRLNSMKSGIKSLISSYGSQSDAIRELIEEYNNLRDAMGRIFGLEKIETPEIFKPGSVSSQIAEWQELSKSIGNTADNSGDLDNLTDADRGFNQTANAIGKMGDAFSALGDFDMPAFDVAGAIAQAVASVAQGYGYANAQAGLEMGPWGWIAFAATGLATMLATISQIKSATAFADGGIAYGPTLGIFGEYAGAQNNPEVVAPLDRLRSLIDAGNGTGSGKVEFEIKGRRLVGILNNESNHISRR